MLRFSIRELLLTTALMAMGFGWWVDRMAIDAKRLAAVDQSHRHRAALIDANKAIKYQAGYYNAIMSDEKPPDPPFKRLDLAVLDEPLVEP
jgi:hypothetical protein